MLFSIIQLRLRFRTHIHTHVAIYLADLQMCFTNCHSVLRGHNICTHIADTYVYSHKFVRGIVRAEFISWKHICYYSRQYMGEKHTYI